VYGIWGEFNGADIMKLLIVEDELRMANLLRRGLSEEGHSVMCAYDGADGLEMARQYEFDVIVLDVMLPKISGYDVAKKLRAEKNATPVLMLTAKDAVPDIVRGLDLGVDDYMTKPFSFEELVARLRAVKRRANVKPDPILRVGDLVLDPASRDVHRGETRLTLTRTEYGLLECLMYRAGKVVPRNLLIESVWGLTREIGENTLDVFMHMLRKKVDGGAGEKLIQTVRGVGYTIRAENAI
jgi:DNA-binding response OmpR family regulator